MTSTAVDTEHTILIPLKKINLDGILYVPKISRGIILFVHGSGSSRLSSRNQFIAKSLQKANFATLLFDLLTPEEEKIDIESLEFRFDLPLLSSRLLMVTDWVINHSLTRNLPIGYYGASTGGGAAIMAAAQRVDQVKAVVSRGGRPDLAGASLSQIEAPTLLIVGGNDSVVIDLNKKAMIPMKNIHQLEIVPNATHLFEEPGALDIVSELSEKWFLKYL